MSTRLSAAIHACATRIVSLHDSDARPITKGCTPDGTGLIMFNVGGCRPETGCSAAELAERRFEWELWDTQTGWPRHRKRPTFLTPQGLAVRLLGWQADGSAVLVLSHPRGDLPPGYGGQIVSETDFLLFGGVQLLRLGQRRIEP